MNHETASGQLAEKFDPFCVQFSLNQSTVCRRPSFNDVVALQLKSSKATPVFAAISFSRGRSGSAPKIGLISVPVKSHSRSTTCRTEKSLPDPSSIVLPSIWEAVAVEMKPSITSAM